MLPATIIFALRNLLTPLTYRYLPTLIIKLSLYYIKLQRNLTVTVNITLQIYLPSITRLVTPISLLKG